MAKTDLAIIGAGPAGMAAAETASQCGLNVTVVDEQGKPGGQILRQPPKEFRVANWLDGKTYRQGKALLHRAENNPAINWLPRSTVSGIFPQQETGLDCRFRLLVDSAGKAHSLDAEAVLIAPGCYDMPVVFPGWNLPGVMAAGGIQAFIKSQQFLPGQRFVFSGSHPLQLVVADQIVQAGGEVAAVLFAQSRFRALELLRQPAVVLQNFGKFGQTAAILARLRRAGVPVRFQQTLVRANGDDALRSVTVAPVGADGLIRMQDSEDIDCDRLGVCYGFLASSELARQCGAECHWDSARGGWIARHDEWMRSSVEQVFVAGEITAVAGSDVAAAEGELAAIGCAAGLGRISPELAGKLAGPVRRKLQRLNRFARLLGALSWPGAGLLDQLMAETATVCKCEELTVGDILGLLQANPHIASVNSAKLLSRTGMGLCQGRYCHHALTRLLSRQLGVPEPAVGAFTARFPAKPIEIGRLANLDA